MAFGCYGTPETWKITYYPKVSGPSCALGVAFVEADCHQMAMQAFYEQYAGQYYTVKSCEKLIK